MSIAQDKAKANFKKAIAYRSKTGCSLKEAFSHIKGKKTVIKKKATIKKVGAIKKKITPKKVAKKKAPKKLKYAGTAKAQDGKKMYKYSLGKKPTEKSILNKIHKVKKDVENLDEAQHAHMSKVGNIIGKVKDELLSIKNLENRINSLLLMKKHTTIPKIKKVYTNTIKKYKDLLKEHKIHLTQLKKHI